MLLILILTAVPVSSGFPSEKGKKSAFWAVVGSTVIPGAGQFYCENYLRGTLFCCAQATLTAMTVYEHVLTEEAHRRYKLTGSTEDYEEYAHHFDRRKDLLWWDVGVLVFSAADAYVDAHMHGFGREKGVDVSVLREEGVGLHVSVHF